MAFPVHSAVSRIVEVADGYGAAWIDPTDEVIAGAHGTWRLTYEAGERGIAAGGRLLIRADSDTDWGIPQFRNPAAEDYMTVEAPAGVRCSARVGGPKSFALEFHGRSMALGERITVTLGDTRQGGAGSRAQTFAEARRHFLIEVDARGNGESVVLAESPCLSIVGGDAERLVVVAPSSVVVGQPFWLLVKAEDRWGNPSSSFQEAVQLSGQGIDFPVTSLPFTLRAAAPPLERGVERLNGITVATPGIYRVRASTDDGQLVANSNPIVVAEPNSDFHLHWADPHGGQVASSAKIGDFFRYARDVSGVQFVGYQRNADVISKEDWLIQQREEQELYQPGHFVPVPGFEWSGQTPEGGHHNVYFRRCDQPVRRNPPAEAPQAVETETELPHIRDVYQAYRNTDTIITPHVGGEHSNLTWHEPTLEPAMEITSTHGSFEWAIREILERGYQLGFLGGSDCYTGRPGDDRPGHQQRRYAKSGLTGIYAREVTRDGFFEAMRARRVYATTGARIVLHIEADGNWLGSKYTTSKAPTVSVDVVGTAPLESVELFRGLQRLYAYPFEHRSIPNRVRILWSGASRMSSYSGIVWDGAVSVTGADIEAVDTIRFDSPRSFCRPSNTETQESRRVSWHAWGCGYPMGIVLGLKDPENAGLQVDVTSQAITGPMYGGHGERGPLRRVSFALADHVSTSVGLDELKHGAHNLQLGILDRRLTVSLDNEPGPESARFEFTDEAAMPGINPYWVRVIQSDQEMAWSSPIFVDFSRGGSAT